jgi:signal-transduction protein with cAMP-binding, CBS, and nucleotidyltransferase domain
MQSTAEHTGLSVANGSARGKVESGGEGTVVARSGGNRRDGGSRVFPFHRASSDAATARVGDLAIRDIAVVPSHLSMAAARKLASLTQMPLLLVERDDHIVGTIDERALAVDHDLTAVAAAMKPLAAHLRPAMRAAEAREQFIRARVDVLPVVAGGFILGAVTRSDLEQARVETR